MPATPSPAPPRVHSESPPPLPEIFTTTMILPPAVVTAAPSPCCSYSANEVTFRLATTLTIPDYHRYYDSPIESFTPTYYALPDGSLITPAYVSDLRGAYSNIIFLCSLIVIFFRNILVSGGYIWRGKVKKKGLFYLLFASQILGPVALLPLIIAYLHDSIDCTVVFILASAACFVSICILVTGILGVKAYLCLDRSRIVAAVLVIIQIAWLTAAVLDGIELHSQRHLSGECDRDTNGMMPVMVALQCAQSCFISCCFIYAVWKSSGLPAARGRISLQLSSMNHLDETPDSHSQARTNNNGEDTRRRGWWDYVPRSEKPAPSSQKCAVSVPRASGFYCVLLSTIGRLWTRHEDSTIAAARKPSFHAELPLPQPARPAVRIPQNLTSPASDRGESSRARSPVPSFTSHHIGLRPRMVLLREVMRDELCYTTFITTLCVVVTILDVVGVNSRMALSVCGWLMLNWVMVSLLAVHSFGRVVHRHEIEAMLQQPWSWDYSFQNGRRATETSRPRSSHPWSPSLSVASRRAQRNTAIGPLDHGAELTDSVEANMPLYRHSKGDDSASISRSSLPSPEPSIGGSSLKVPLHLASGSTPSPSTEEFPLSYSGFNPSVDTTSPEPQQSVFTPADLHFQEES